MFEPVTDYFLSPANHPVILKIVLSARPPLVLKHVCLATFSGYTTKRFSLNDRLLDPLDIRRTCMSSWIGLVDMSVRTQCYVLYHVGRVWTFVSLQRSDSYGLVSHSEQSRTCRDLVFGDADQNKGSHKVY